MPPQPLLSYLSASLAWPVGRRREWAGAGGQARQMLGEPWVPPALPGYSPHPPPDLLTQACSVRTQDWRTAGTVNRSQTLCGWGAGDVLTTTALGLCPAALFLKSPSMPALSSLGAELCGLLLPGPLLPRQDDFLSPPPGQEFVPSMKAALHTLCHLERCQTS